MNSNRWRDKWQFRFEPMWQVDPVWKDIVKTKWEEEIIGSASFVFMEKPKLCSKQLTKWHKANFANIDIELKEVENQLAL